MRNIFESAKNILEASVPSAYQIASLRKVMMATGASSSDVAAIVSKLKTNSVKDGFLLNIVTVLADSPRLFQPFIKEFKNSTFDGGTVDEEAEIVTEAKGAKFFIKPDAELFTAKSNGFVYKLGEKYKASGSRFKDRQQKELDRISTDKKYIAFLLDGTSDVFLAVHEKDISQKAKVNEETLTEDKLQNDIASLKKIGWKLDKVIPFMVTKGNEYGVKITSDLVTMYYNDKGNTIKYATDKDGKAVMLPGTNIKVSLKGAKPEKKPKWPNDPPKSKINDPQHAEAFIAQAMASEESPDMTGTEAYSILDQAGYTKQAIMWVIRNFGWDDADFKRTAVRNKWV